MNENPWAYYEARNRLREEKEQERRRLDAIIERFEKEKEYARSAKRFDIFELKYRIETSNSLLSLQKEIQNALKEWYISREMFDVMKERIEMTSEQGEFQKKAPPPHDEGNTEDIPFSETEWAQFFEKKKLWESIFVDIAGFSYGFFVQWGAILVILLWKILLDIIFLPRDIYTTLKK